MVQDQSMGFLKMTQNAEGVWLSLLAYLSKLEKLEIQGRPFCVKLHWPRGRAMQSTCSHFSSLLMLSVLVSEVLDGGENGASDSPPCSMILSIVSCPWIDVGCSSCGRKQSQEPTMSLFWWCHFLILFEDNFKFQALYMTRHKQHFWAKATEKQHTYLRCTIKWNKVIF